MPEGFEFTIRDGASPDVWVPLEIRRAAGGQNVRLLARLKPGMALAQARANMDGLARDIERALHPYNGPHGEDAGYGVSVVLLREQIFGAYREGTLLLFGAVALVLLIACANVANLVLTRRSGRARDLAIRRSLGATRLRMLGELSVESVVLAVSGGCLGFALAAFLTRLLPTLAPLPAQISLAVDWRVLAFCFVATLVAAVLSGVLPGVLPETGRRRRFRGALVAVEACLSVVLLAGAGLLLKSFVKLQAVNPGYNPEHVLSMRVTLPPSKYRNAIERLRALPGVRSAAAVSRLPLSGGGRGGDPFSIEGRAYSTSGRVPQVATTHFATLDYWNVLRIPLIAGRVFDAHDAPGGPPVAVINEAMARGFWNGAEDALGRHIMLGAPRPGAQWMTIVGVVGDVRTASLRIDPIPQIYVPYGQSAPAGMFIVLRTERDPMAVAVSASRQIAAIDPDQPVFEVRTLEERFASSIGRDRFQTSLLGAFSLIALLLAAMGIYGVLAQSVARRTREIGIRMAVGARRGDVLRLIVAQGMAPALAGLAAGVACALGFTRLLASQLFATQSTDAATYCIVIAVFVVVALAACYLPALRATRVEPMEALRYE